MKNTQKIIFFNYNESRKSLQIIPIKNTPNDLSEQSEQVKAQYKFVIRKKSLSNILLTMRIMFESQEFSIDYYNVDYRDNEYIEIFATKVVQL